jgi:hypothetical protein
MKLQREPAPIPEEYRLLSTLADRLDEVVTRKDPARKSVGLRRAECWAHHRCARSSAAREVGHQPTACNRDCCGPRTWIQTQLKRRRLTFLAAIQRVVFDCPPLARLLLYACRVAPVPPVSARRHQQLRPAAPDRRSRWGEQPRSGGYAQRNVVPTLKK